MSTEPHKSESTLEEQLVAYLDGELDAEDARRIEERLAFEPGVRETLQRLERTWECLDVLDAPPVDDRFTRSTLEMVAVDAEKQLQQLADEAPRRRRRRRLAILGGLVAAAALGFGGVMALAPNPNQQLIEDLPVLENLDEYRQADNLQFLMQLRDADLFGEEQHDG